MIEDLRHLFEDVLRRPMPPLERSTRFDALPGWDSVAHLALLLAVEQRFHIAFTSAQMVAMQTVGDMLTHLERTP